MDGVPNGRVKTINIPTTIRIKIQGVIVFSYCRQELNYTKKLYNGHIFGFLEPLSSVPDSSRRNQFWSYHRDTDEMLEPYRSVVWYQIRRSITSGASAAVGYASAVYYRSIQLRRAEIISRTIVMWYNVGEWWISENASLSLYKMLK